MINHDSSAQACVHQYLVGTQPKRDQRAPSDIGCDPLHTEGRDIASNSPFSETCADLHSNGLRGRSKRGHSLAGRTGSFGAPWHRDRDDNRLHGTTRRSGRPTLDAPSTLFVLAISPAAGPPAFPAKTRSRGQEAEARADRLGGRRSEKIGAGRGLT